MSRPRDKPRSGALRRYAGRAITAVGIALVAWSGWLKAEDASRTVFGILFVGGLAWVAGRVIAEVPRSDETTARLPKAQGRRGWRSFPVTLVLVVLTACWTALTLAAAIMKGDGHGPVFVAALVILALVLGALLLALWRMVRADHRRSIRRGAAVEIDPVADR